MAEQELGAPFQHQPLAGFHVVGDQVHRCRGTGAEAAQPFREEGEGENMGGGEAQGGKAGGGLRRFLASLLQAADDIPRRRQKHLAARGQTDRVRGTVHQRRAGPHFQRADAAAEGRLGEIPRFRRAGKTPAFGKGGEVLKPRQLQIPSPSFRCGCSSYGIVDKANAMLGFG